MRRLEPVPAPDAPFRRRVALVLSGGGARGAYEAGVLSYLFESIYPELPRGFEFDVVSGTSVGAIHAAYVAASARQQGRDRSKGLLETWRGMRLRDVVRIHATDVLNVPLRALGLTRLARTLEGGGRPATPSAASSISPPSSGSSPSASPGGRCARTSPGSAPARSASPAPRCAPGRITVFQDGALADPKPWANDPNARAVLTEIGASHVRASAAIPFLFPAIRIGDHFYVDGGLRMNTPLTPALRLAADRVLVVALKHAPRSSAGLEEYPEDSITQPAFLLGKVLNTLLLDQLEYELRKMELVNAWIERGQEVYGEDFLARMNVAVIAQRGIGYRHVKVSVVRPSEDVGGLAARCRRQDRRP